MIEKSQSPCIIAKAVYDPVFRTEFSQAGFVLIDLGPDCGSETQRQLMVNLKSVSGR